MGSENGDYWEATVQVLQSPPDPLVAKPKLTQKLLTKPPFRFIHDVVSAVQAKTGFAQDLFQGEELVGKEIKDKEAKLAYLNKIVGVVEICVGQNLEVKTTKVIAGLEPEQTNKFLQALGAAALAGDGREAVQAVLQTRNERRESGESGKNMEGGMVEDKSGNNLEKNILQDKNKYEDVINQQDFSTPQQDAVTTSHVPTPLQDAVKIQAERDVSKQQTKPEKQPQPPKEPHRSGDKDIKKEPMDLHERKAAEVSPVKMIRPQSAKKAPPRIIQQHETRQSVALPSEEPNMVGVMQEGEIDDDENVIDVVHEAAALPNVDTQGQQGMLVGDILAAEEKFKDVNNSYQDKNEQSGGIVLKRAGKNQEGGGQKMQDSTQLQQTIQKFCSSVNPLGKCLDFLEENLENMNLELKFWVQEQKSQQTNLGAQQSNNASMESQQVQALKSQIAATDKQIEQGCERANALKAQIFQNDVTISKLLNMAILGT